MNIFVNVSYCCIKEFGILKFVITTKLPFKKIIQHTIEYYSPLKEGNSGTCYNMDEPWRHDAK